MSNVATIVSFFRGKGVPDDIIAGILGNLQTESSLDPNAYNSNENAVGLAQWEGGRLTNLKNFAAQSGGSIYDLNTQLNFLWHEMNTSESSAWSQVKGATNAGQAAALWDQYYERSSGSSRQQRVEYASQYASSGLTDVPGLTSGHSTESGGAQYLGTDTSTGNTALNYQNALGDIGDLINSIPELKQMLQKAMSSNEDVNSFVNDVENSKWWKSNSQTVRAALALKSNDPATYGQNLTAAEAHVQQMANSLGVGLTTAQVKQFALSTIYQNITDATLQTQIGAAYNGSNASSKGGQSVTLQQQLTQLAASYGVPVTPAWMNKWIQTDLSTGNGLEGATADLQKQAASLYPVYAKDIESGKTVADIASPYQATMANLLEIDPNSIQVTDPTIQKALQAKGADGAPTQVPLWQFQDQLRQDPRWQQTDNAKQSAYSMLHQLGADFGFAT